MFLPLLILTLISATGLLLYTKRTIPSRYLNLLIGLGAGSMLSVALVHILPESLEQTEMAIYAFVAGFLAIYILEELLTPHHHDHAHGDHSHEDPHEHYDHVAVVSFIAIFAHTLLDGLGIRAGMGLSDTAGYAILFGVAVHQIPVSLSLAAIFRESKFEKKRQILFLVAFALAAPIGYLIADIFLHDVDAMIAGLAAAFAGGSLLYVATADLLPVIHSQGRWKLGTFILGVIAMSSVWILWLEHGHETEEVHDTHIENH
jgi:zinc transporter, ZIP family